MKARASIEALVSPNGSDFPAIPSPCTDTPQGRPRKFGFNVDFKVSLRLELYHPRALAETACYILRQPRLVFDDENTHFTPRLPVQDNLFLSALTRTAFGWRLATERARYREVIP
jgi:hypothetical protein